MGKWLNEYWKWSEGSLSCKHGGRQEAAFCWVEVNLTAYVADENIFQRLLIPMDLYLHFQISIKLLLRAFSSHIQHIKILCKKRHLILLLHEDPPRLLLLHISHFINFYAHFDLDLPFCVSYLAELGLRICDMSKRVFILDGCDGKRSFLEGSCKPYVLVKGEHHHRTPVWQ